MDPMRCLSLIRFRGHLPKGGYCGQNGIKQSGATGTPAVQGLGSTGRAARRTTEQRATHAPPHVLFTLGNARCACPRHSGTGGARRSDDDATLHAPDSGDRGKRDAAVGVATDSWESWQTCGNGDSRRSVVAVEQVNWRRERDSDLTPFLQSTTSSHSRPTEPADPMKSHGGGTFQVR